MIELVKSAQRIQRFLEFRKWRFCFIGGLAVLRWGEPRLTGDIDITLLTGFGGEREYIDALTAKYQARQPGMREFATRNRVLLLVSPEGFPVDVALGALPFEETMIERSSLYQYDKGIVLRTCSAEDLIVAKAFAERDRDWGDVESIAIRQAGKLDWKYIRRQLRPLAEIKNPKAIMEKLEAIKRRAGK